MHFGFLVAYVNSRDEFESTQTSGEVFRRDLFAVWCGGGEL